MYGAFSRRRAARPPRAFVTDFIALIVRTRSPHCRYLGGADLLRRSR